MIEQFAIAVTSLFSIVAFASNRILAGSIIGLIGIPFWLYAVPNEQWGILIAVGVNTAVYSASTILRLLQWAKRKKYVKDNDEYNHLSDAM
jgi:hypothetical protein